MGDRCNVNVRVLPKDRDEFVRIVGEPHQEDGCQLDYEDANYALYQELHDAADACLTFVAYNGEGDDYGHGAIASDEEETFDVDTNASGFPVVTVPVLPANLDNATGFLALVSRISKLLEL